jgi:ubiquinone/menaquinone biosynthesis C-methylase UbiE
MQQGYEGTYSDHVSRYDEEGLGHYTRIALQLLEGLDLQDKRVLDVGCGTGILSFLAIEKGAANVVCGDLSQYMLDQCQAKAVAKGLDLKRLDFCQLDSESLPFSNNSFDVVLSSMVLGLVPNQEETIGEMVRVLHSGGSLAVSTHGPRHYMEAINAAFKVTPKRYLIGYRIEFWPREEEELWRLLSQASLVDIRTDRFSHQDSFESGESAYDFFACTSASWWYARFPQDKVEQESQRARAYFERKRVSKITQDVVFAYGRKL